MKKVNLQIAIITVITIVVSTFAPIAYATTTGKTAIATGDKVTTENTNNGDDKKTEEIDDNKTTTEDTIKDEEEIVVVIDGERKIEGEDKKDIRLEFSASNMPKIEIKRKHQDKITGLGTKYSVVYNEEKKNDTQIAEIIENAQESILFEVVDINNNILKTIYIVKNPTDTTKYNITTSQDWSKGVYFYNNTLVLEKNKSSFEFVYENVGENIFSDVKVTIEDGKIAEIVKGEYGAVSIKSLDKIGATTATFEGQSVKNGKVKMNVYVVDSIYEYTKNLGGSNQGSTTKPGGSSNTGSTSKPNGGSNTGNTSNPNVTTKPNDTNQGNTNNDKEDNKEENKDNEENKDDEIQEDYTYVKYDERENIYSDYTKLNEELLQKTDTLEVTVEGDHLVKSNVFKALKKYPNKKLVINSTASGVGRISWEFDSNTITNTNIDFKPSAQFSTEKLNSIKNNEADQGIFMDLAHNGELPGKATISLWIGDELAEKYIDQVNEPIYLYYYNPTTKQYEFVGNAQMVDYGTIKFGLEHCSIYLFSSEKLEGKTSRPLDEEPKTGVENYACLASLTAIISLAGIIILKKQKVKYGKHFINN